MLNNPIIDSDSYKSSHYLQYPEGAQVINSYIEPRRGGDYEFALFFGLQAWLQELSATPINQAMIDEAENLLNAHGLPFNRSGWERIAKVHKGILPLEIEAIPEGLRVPAGTALVQVRNTDEALPWLVPYVETSMLRAVWYPTTVATVSSYCYDLLRSASDKSAETQDALPFALHDFGCRGAASAEAAALGGMAHLVRFQGTDTVPALVAAQRFYGADMAGYSIPAAEHSTIILWGQERETDAYAHIIKQFSSAGSMVSIVADSYDYWNAIEQFCTELKPAIDASAGTVVIRPDSGDPIEIVPQTLKRLARSYTPRINAKGFAVLPDNIRLIQGDGINPVSLKRILDAILDAGFSSENVTFGMGGGLLQKLDRDTLRFAMKPSAALINGQWRDVSKQPATDASKASRAGKLTVYRNGDGNIITERAAGWHDKKLLQVVWRNGLFLKRWNFEEVRANANK